MYLMPLYDPVHLNDLGQIKLPQGSHLTVAFLFEGKITANKLQMLSEDYQVSVVEFNEIVGLVDQIEASNKATEVVSKIACDGYLGEKVHVLSNMLSLHIHSSVHTLCVIDALLERGQYTSVITFGCWGTGFNFPERTDVKTLYYPEMSKTALINAYVKEKGISVVCIKVRSSLLVRGASLLRRLLLNGYKFCVTLKRRLQTSSTEFNGLNPDSNANVGILIRAQSEYWTVKPLLTQLKKSGYNPVIIQDDLIKNPSSKKTLDSDSASYIPIHSAIGVYKLISIWVVSTFRFLFGVTKISKTYRSSGASTSLERVFLSSDKAPIWIASSLHSLPELSVFEYELKQLINRYSFECLITMDMVDQWSAVVGDIGREYKVKTLIIQNTVLDDIIYPRPIATDYMAVSGEKVQKLLIRSGALDSRILNFGLPIHDDIYHRYIPHVMSESGSFKVIVATQPFIQSYDYNRNLIEDVFDVLNEYGIEANLIIKPHPRENSSLYVKLVDSLKPSEAVRVSVETSDNILEMAKGCDLFVSRTSTALQSYIMLGRLSIAYLNEYPEDICERLDYLSSDACVKLSDKNQLRSYISNLLEDYDNTYSNFMHHRQNYINHCIGCFEGNAAESICRFVLS